MNFVSCTIARVAYSIGIVLLPSLFTSLARAASPVTSTATQLTASPAAADAGARFTLVANVKDEAGEPVANGSVTFYDGGKVLGTVQVVRNISAGGTIGTATYKTFFLPPGANVITATYKGAGAGSTSSPETVEVTGRYPSATVLSASGAEGNYALTGTVSGAGPGSPTGLVTFADAQSASPLGSALLDPKTLTRSFPAVGTVTCPEVTFGARRALVADLNGDGIPDLIAEIPTHPSNGLIAMLGNGDGTYRCGGFTVDAMNVFQTPPIVGDFDGDGLLDVIVPEESCLDVYLGNGDGTFKPPQKFGTSFFQVAAYDMNGDGILDIVGEEYGRIDVLFGNPDGSFQAAIPTAAPAYFGFTVGDFNRDGKPDVVFLVQPQSTVSTDSEVYTLLGNGDGTFQTLLHSTVTNFVPGYLTSGDLNGDGKLDLVLGGSPPNHANGVAVMLGNGEGTFGNATLIYENSTTMDSGEKPLLADMNGDGILDVVAPRDEYPDIESNELFYADILYGKGDGAFQPAISYPISSFDIEIADVNSDGKQDLVVLSNATLYIAYVYLNQVTEAAKLTGVTLPGIKADKVTAGYAGDDSFAHSTSNTLILTSEPITGGATSTPTFSPAAGTYASTFTAEFASSTPHAAFYYTTDGSTPTVKNARASSGRVTVNATETVKVIAIATGFTASAPATVSYLVPAPAATPTFSPAAGTYTTAQTVYFTSATPNAAYYYTTDGSAPSVKSARASNGRVIVSTTETVKVLAISANSLASAPVTASFTIE